MDVADRAGRVGEVLLADEHEGPLGHDPPMHRCLIGDDFVEITAEMDRAGLARRGSGTWHAFLDGEVDLERARAVSESAIRAGDPARQPIAEDVGGDRRRNVQHQDVARREFADGGDALARLDDPTVRRDVGSQRVGDRLGAAFGDDPYQDIRGS